MPVFHFLSIISQLISNYYLHFVANVCYNNFNMKNTQKRDSLLIIIAVLAVIALLYLLILNGGTDTQAPVNVPAPVSDTENLETNFEPVETNVDNLSAPTTLDLQPLTPVMTTAPSASASDITSIEDIPSADNLVVVPVTNAPVEAVNPEL